MTVVVASRYQAGPIHKFLLGPTYRRLWTTPVQVDVLDLGRFAGGLKPVKKGGGKETRSLRFEGADGREWHVRSVDKNPVPALPRILQKTFVDQLAQDQISAANPAGALIVDGLSEAAGIPWVPHKMVVIPDDPRLGEFREEFAGMVGMLEEDPRLKEPVTPGFEGYEEKLDTVELWERLDDHPEEQVDTRAFLKARLFDLFIGDFDRHDDQWDWLKPGDGAGVPPPKDRDEAFASSRFAVARTAAQPKLGLRKNYPASGSPAGALPRPPPPGRPRGPVWREVAPSQGPSPIPSSTPPSGMPQSTPGSPERRRRPLKSRRNQLWRGAKSPSSSPATRRSTARQVRRRADPARRRRPRNHDGSAEGGAHLPALRPGRGRPQARLRQGATTVVRSPETSRLLVRASAATATTSSTTRAGGHALYDSVSENRVVEGPGTRIRTALRAPGTRTERRSATGAARLPVGGRGGDLALGAQVSGRATGSRKDPYQSRQTLRRLRFAQGVRAE